MATAKTHMLCWTPNSNQVALVPWPDTERRSDSYDSTCLACDSCIQGASFAKRKLIVYVEALKLVVRDGVDPLALHRALLPLREYRSGLAEDSF